MLKKVTAVLFLAFASTIMLAFAVLPHHHHEAYLCFATNHCEQEFPGSSSSHQEEPEDTQHGCVKNLFETPVSRIQSGVHNCEQEHCCHFTLTFFVFSDILTFLSQEAEQRVCTPGFYREKLHPACFIQILAGRAPPRG